MRLSPRPTMLNSSQQPWPDHLFQPRHTLLKRARKHGCNSSHTDRPLITAIIQTFGDGQNAQQLAARLHVFEGMEVCMLSQVLSTTTPAQRFQQPFHRSL